MRDLLVFGTEKNCADVTFEDFDRIYFIENPVFGVTEEETYFLKGEGKTHSVLPYLLKESSVFHRKEAMIRIIKELLINEAIYHYAIWTDSATTMPLIRSLAAEVIVYNQHHEDPDHNELENELLEYADFVYKQPSGSITGLDPLIDSRTEVR